MVLLTSLALLAGLSAPARAADEARGRPALPAEGLIAPTLDGPWRFRVALNGWLPDTLEISVDERVGNNSDTLDKSTSWLLRKLEYFFPINAEVRKGSFGAYVHTIFFRIDGDLDVGPGTFDWNDPGWLIDAGLSYELGRWKLGTGAGAPTLTVEPYAGIRWLRDRVDIDLTRIGRSTAPDFTYVAPVVGGRLFLDLGKHWNLEASGDYGGWDVDDLKETYLLRGLIGYRWPGWGVHWNLQAGYRVMRLLQLQKSAIEIEADVKGPNVVLSVEF